MLEKAATKTIYLKQSPIGGDRDKAYSLRLGLMRPGPRFEPLNSAEIKIILTQPGCSIVREEDIVESGWYADLATDTANAGIMLSVGGLCYGFAVKVIHPETYRCELDWWLRTRCQCRLVASADAPRKSASARIQWIQSIVETIGQQLDEGVELCEARTPEPNLRLAVELRKEFENGGVVIHVDFYFVECHELEAIESQVAPFADSTVPRDAEGSGDDERMADSDRWPTMEKVDETEASLQRIFPSSQSRDLVP
jgi:hypothetical protein